MALKTKVDYFGLASSGIEVASTEENRTQASVEASGPNGFVVATQAFGDENLAPKCDYIVTGSASLASVALGSVTTIDSKAIALASISITTRAGEAPTISATGQQIESGGEAHCTATLSKISLSSLYHAQTFGLFTVSGGQLQESNLTAEGNIATSQVDGVIKSSDLVGGKITISGTIIGVSDAGVIGKPTLALASGVSGTITQPLTETNPNGDYPTYAFTIEIPLAAD